MKCNAMDEGRRMKCIMRHMQSEKVPTKYSGKVQGPCRKHHPEMSIALAKTKQANVESTKDNKTYLFVGILAQNIIKNLQKNNS